MHVAFFNRSFHPDVSATGQLLTELCEDLVARYGCRVTVVAGPSCVSGDHRGIRVVRASGTRFSKTRFAGRAANYVTYFLSACRAALTLDRPDVVVALTDPPIVGLAGWLAAKRFRAPLVMSYRDLFPEAAALLEDFHSDAVNASLQAVNRFLVQRAARSVALGPAMRRRLIEHKGAPPERTVIIPDWADTSAIVPGPKANAFTRAHGLSEKFVVMHSGNIGLSQGLEALVDAAALLRDLPDLQVVFVGDGVRKDALRERAAALGLANVTFLPYEPKEALSTSFAAADLFVVSLRRGMAGAIVPSKLYGILAAGRPYVAAVEEDCEVAELTRAHDCGRVCEPGDARALADAIAAFHRDRDLAAACGLRARTASLAFDRGAQVDRYLALFREVAPGAPQTLPAPLAALLRGKSPRRDAFGDAGRRAAFLRDAAFHGVEGLLRRQLTASGAWADLPQDVAAALDDVARQEAVLETLRRRETARVAGALAESGVAALVLKGAALAFTHYPSPHLRPCADVDLLIPKADRDRAVAALGAAGYTRVISISRDAVHAQWMFERRSGSARHVVDLHWAVSNRPLFAGLLTFDELAGRAVAVAALGDGILTPCPVDALLLACLHRLAHHEDSLRLIWLYDVKLLAERLSPVEQAAVVERAMDKQIAAVCHRSLALAGALLGLDEATRAWVDRLGAAARARTEPSAAYINATGEWRQLVLDVKATRGPASKLRLALQHVFPDTEYMRQAYGARGRLTLAAAYGRRAAAGVWRILQSA